MTITQLTGFGVAVAAPGVVTNTDTGKHETILGTVATFATRSIGDAAPGRLIVAGIGMRAQTGAITVSGVTIGGIAATLVVANPNGDNEVSFWIAAVPTGTTATIVATASVVIDDAAVGVWCLTGVPSLTAFDTTSTDADPASVNDLTIPGGGVAIGFGFSSTGGGGNAAWSGGLVENFDLALDTTRHFNGASAAFAATATPTLVCDYTTASQTCTIFASWAGI